MQNPPAYVQVDAAGQSSRPNFQYSPLYARLSPSRENDLSGMPNILVPPHHLGGHHPHHSNHHAAAMNSAAAEINASRLQQLHNRLGGPYGSPGGSLPRKGMTNGGLVPPGLPNFPNGGGGGHHHHQSRSLAYEHHSLPSTATGTPSHSPNLNEAFVNSFGLTSSAFLNPYSFAADRGFPTDRARTPSPLHRFLHSQLLGGQYHGGAMGNEHHFTHDDFLLDSGPFRGLNLSTNFAAEERQNTDPLITSGHLSRSLDDLSVVLDNSNESADLSLRHRNDSSSPDDSYKNDFTQSSEHTNSNPPSRSASSHGGGKVMSNSSTTAKQRRLTTNSRADISRTCPTCGKTFGNSSGLAKHRLTHSDERKYLCQICMKSFKRQDHLSGHLLTHSEKKPFACPVENCGKSYCDSRSLKRHLDQHESWMIPDNVRLMFSESNPTDDTEDTMSSVMENQEVQSFSRSAEQLRPFACQICRRRFKNGPALNGHMRLHGGFFSKKNGAGDYSAPPSVQSSINMDYSSAVQSPVDMMDRSEQDEGSRHGQSMSEAGDWNNDHHNDLHSAMSSPVPPALMYHHSDSMDNSLNHVAVIRHVPPALTGLKGQSALPPVSTLASPTNSPTSLTASFTFQHYPGQHSPPSSAPQSVMPQQQATLTVPPVTGKHRRHSDSDNVVPAKRPCTVTDMLRHTITMNIARKSGGSSPGGEGIGMQGGFQSDMPNRSTEARSQFSQDMNGDSVFQSHSMTGELENRPTPGNHHSSAEFDDHNPLNQNHSPTSDFRSADSPVSLVGSLTSGSDLEYPDSPFGSSDAGTSKKLKRKHRPEPLIIPPHCASNGANQGTPLLSPGAGFPSMLRSPRLPNPDTKSGCTPPPYTPPPMLSPTRRGSGLFWNVIASTGNVGSTTPQSGSRFLLKRSLSNSSSSHVDFRNPLSGRIGEEVADVATESPFNFAPFAPAPETDSTPHINIGNGHQADLPAFTPHSNDLFRLPVHEDPVWIPGVADGLADRDLEFFASLADTAALPKGGQNAELAYHVLFHSAGDVLRALKVLMSKDELVNFVARHSALRTYHYQNSDIWSAEEITAYTNALMKFDKDFFLVAAEIPSKNVRQCVEFYYNWKKILPDECRRMKASRRRRQQDLVTRSRSAQLAQKLETAVTDVVKFQPAAEQTSSYTCTYPSCGNTFGTKQALSAHSRVHLSRGSRIPATLDMCPPPLPVLSLDDEPLKFDDNGLNSQFPFAALSEPPADFPCKLCGKKFTGVKSRNAHMKVHSKAENQPVNMMERL